MIYKILGQSEWQTALAQGAFRGSAVDLADGYIHFSTAAQVRDTAAKHFAGQAELLLVAIDPGDLGAALRWEPSRGGALFPHLYAELDVRLARAVVPLPLDAEGRHVFPAGMA